jgi:hypothetical protein
MAYFANGSEGMYLEEQCADCPLGEKGCPIYLNQVFYNYDQLKPGNEQLRESLNELINKDGICQMRQLLKEAAHA